ncbi:hypothetical protein K458DRAFT_410912 [Lentithecium fluviatile CBS 122367]|uniref:Fork-head domain-containing protein n=1 Tax=Lentithecium fluviatile CBS 122367 TaxID=1168545 RepID=A0A6G1ICD8_9PLEO|nr:hypothetical protein K458DRAFT_410912 [Lentithecium fluviatile CBS 122367]
MPHPQSPHRPSSADLTGGFCGVHPSKDTFGAPMPLHPQVPLPSPSPHTSMVASNMATSFDNHKTSKEELTGFMNLTDPNAMQWSAYNGQPFNHMSQDGNSCQYSLQYSPESTEIYSYGQNLLPYNNNYNLTYSAVPSSSCPRTYTNAPDLTGLPTTIQESYPPAAYQIEPQRPHETMDLSDQGINGHLMELREDYDYYSSTIKHEEHSDYSSPYDSDVTRSSTPSGDPPMPPHNFKGEEAAIDKEQPYAQLIYRALMEAPSRTMILRDIYDWFQKNTDKAADKETKGWQNSIRHNLSMNGAFEKVDHPSEEAKKGFMWRLTDEAIREGVKSTTRYRSKLPNKRGHRSHHPQPQRQASGAKGGQAARRAARMRRSTRREDAYRSDPYPMSRSVPDIPMPLSAYSPHSPYFGSGSDTDLDYVPEDFGNPLGGSNMELFNRSYTGTPLSQQSTAVGDSAYIELPMNPADPLFTNSPSPSADEPRTPEEQGQGGWGDEVALAGGSQFVFDVAYGEYAV